jgi:hypothetical protein
MRVLRQTSSVSDYWDKFSRLRHQLLLYNPHIDEGHFIDEFIAGLRDDIRSAIWLHRPQELETAHLLALMHEEEAAPMKKKSYSKHEYKETSLSKWNNNRLSDEHKNDNKQGDSSKEVDKLEALRAFRRSKGLCFTCGEKYSRSHKCPDKVPLHVIEELLEVLQIQSSADDSDDSSSDSETETPSGAVMVLGKSSLSAASRKKSFQLHGTIGKHHLLILIDSGSVSSFISAELVEKLQCTTKPLPPATFVVANGAKMQCDTYVPQLEWMTQGHTFNHDVKVLSLGCYDMILGEDWLDHYNRTPPSATYRCVAECSHKRW